MYRETVRLKFCQKGASASLPEPAEASVRLHVAAMLQVRSKNARRFAQLVKQLNDAIADDDYGRESRVHSELESIAAVIRDRHEIAKARSLERRRILAAINRSLAQIRKHDPKLAQALGGALKTRGFFSYSPESTGLPADPTDPKVRIKKPPQKD
jgi:hypothetical protein